MTIIAGWKSSKVGGVVRLFYISHLAMASMLLVQGRGRLSSQHSSSFYVKRGSGIDKTCNSLKF